MSSLDGRHIDNSLEKDAVKTILLSLDSCNNLSANDTSRLLRDMISNSTFQRLLTIHQKLTELSCLPCHSYNNHGVYDLAGDIYEQFRSHQLLTDSPRELLSLLSKPTLRAVFDAHDRVAYKDFHPVLPEVSDQVDEDEEAVKIVRIEKRKEPLGATLRVGESGLAYIARVLAGGPADKSGVIHVGDEVHEVNGLAVHGRSVEEVAQLMSMSERSIVLKLIPAQQSSTLTESKFTVRANFAYKPDDDLGIPCREAGMAFSRGDILHVVSVRDANWWQAYKECKDQQHAVRARLVPSRTLQERRCLPSRSASTSSPSNSIPGSPTVSSRSSKRATLPILAGSLVSPRLYRKMRKAKRLVYEALSNEGLLESSSYGELFGEDLAAPYEEVKLYQSLPTRRRPLVLVGPAGVGRNELKLRLLSDKRFKSPVPHTSRSRKLLEADGKDYYFVTRSEMEKNIEMNRYVEHGEYKDHLYAIAYDTIIEIIQSGKICLMTPQPQTLRLLRLKEIKPFTVFIKPSPVEALKQTASSLYSRTGDQDERLMTDMVLSAARMEAVYGHYFDYVLNFAGVVSSAYKELLSLMNKLDCEPCWVPSDWTD